MYGLLLSDDLMFTSRIGATAQANGLAITSVRDSAALLASAAQSAPVCVLIDLGNPGLDIAAVVKALKNEKKPTIVAYGSHVDVETLNRAREAGCDVVLPRSKFVAELETELPNWFGV